MRTFALFSILACLTSGIAALPAASASTSDDTASATTPSLAGGSARPSPPTMPSGLPSGMPNGTFPCGPPPSGNFTMGNATLPMDNSTMITNGTMGNGTDVCGPMSGPGGNDTEGGRGGRGGRNGTETALPSVSAEASASAVAVESASASA